MIKHCAVVVAVIVYMVVGFTTTYGISAYHHWCCEFESRSGRGVHHSVIKVCHWLATGRWFSPGPSVSSSNKTDWNIVESGVKHHETVVLVIFLLLYWITISHFFRIKQTFKKSTFYSCFHFIIFFIWQFFAHKMIKKTLDLEIFWWLLQKPCRVEIKVFYMS